MNRNLKLVGIGIFSWIAIGMFVYLIDRAIKDIFFEFIPVKAVIIFAVTKSLNVILYVLGVKYLISKINATKFDESKLLKKSFISYEGSTIKSAVSSIASFFKMFTAFS